MKKNTRSTRSNDAAPQFDRLIGRMYSYLSSLSRKRSNGVVTADDAHRYLDRAGVPSRQIRTRLRYINSVLRTPNFSSVGSTRSSRPVARGRTITEWSAE